MALSAWLKRIRQWSGLKKPKTRRHRHFRGDESAWIQTEFLEDRTLLATVNWTGGGDGSSWTDAANWDIGLPADGDDVVISSAAAVTIDVTDNVTARSLNSDANVSIVLNGGVTLQAEGGSSVVAGPAVLAGSTILATGVGTSVTFLGAVEISGTNLTASAGGVLSMPNAAQYRHASTGNDQHRTIRAEGAGSRIELAGVESITGGSHWNARLFVQAADGGVIDLSGTRQIVDRSDGDLRHRSIDVSATDAGSQVLLDSLTYFADQHSQGGNSRYSTLSATSGGEVHAPVLTDARGIHLTLDGTGALATAQFTSFTHGRIDVNGVNMAFPAMENLTSTNLFATDSVVSLNALNSLDGAGLQATTGAVIAIPNVSSYSHASTANDQHRTIRAEGAGSRIELSGVESITGGSHWNARLFVQAADGGVIDLSGTRQIVDRSDGDLSHRSIDVSATDADSQVLLDSLTYFADQYSRGRNSRYSTLSATSGGEVRVPALTDARGIHLTLDGTGTLSTGQFASFTHGRIDVNGVNMAFTALQDLTSTNLFATDSVVSLEALTSLDGAGLQATTGAVIAIPNVSSYSHASTGNDQHRYLRAEGTGSRIELSGVESITGGTHWNSRVFVQATGGGVIDLSGTRQIVDRSDGDLSFRSIDVSATDAGSQVLLDSLTYFTDLYSQGRNSLYSTLAATSGGEVRVPTLTDARGIHLTLDATGTLATDQLMSFTHGRIDVDGFDRDFAGLANATNTVISARAGTLSFPVLQTLRYGSVTLNDGADIVLDNVSDIDGTSLYVNSGQTLELPRVNSINHASTGNDQHRYLRAAGAGSRIELSGVESISGGTHWNSRVFVQATDGGVIDLSGTRQIVDRSDGDLSFRSIDVSATGAGSQVLLDSLTYFSDLYSQGRNSLYSTLAATSGGEVRAPTLTDARGIHLTLDATGTLATDQFTSFTYGRIDVNGFDRDFAGLANATGTVINATAGTLSFPVLQTLRFGSVTLDDGADIVLDNVSDIDGTSLYVNSGQTLELPRVTSINHASTGNDQHRYLRAAGAGSRIELSGVESITGGTHWNSRFFVQAESGGVIDLSGTRQIVDRSDGDLRYRSTDVTAVGTASEVFLDSLVNYIDQYGTSATSEALFSTISELQGGVVHRPLLTLTPGVQFVTDPPPEVRTAGTGGSATLSGHQFQSTVENAIWIGGSGNWSDPGNWLSGALPAVGADVRIEGDASISVNIDVTVDILNLTTDASLVLHAGRTFAARGRVSVAGDVTLQAGSALRMSGVFADFQAGGAVVVHGSSLYATDGAMIDFASATEYRHASTGNDQHRVIRAEGVGSRIDLSGVTRIEGGTHWNARLFVQAINGGEVDLSGTTRIEEATSGDFSFRSIDTSATGAGSLVRLDALTSYTDEHTGVRNSVYSTLSASLGGEVRTPLLTTLRGVNLQLNATGTIPVQQIASLQNGYVNLAGNKDWSFPNLVSAKSTTIFASSGDVNFPALTDFENAGLTAIGGSVITLPLVTEYRHASTGNDQHRVIRAEGAGSVIDLSNVVRIEGGTHWNARLFVQAINGGRIDLSRVTRIEEAAGGDFSHRSIDTTATGAGSLIRLDALTSYTDEHAGVRNGVYSTLSASLGGEVRAPLLTTLRGVSLHLNTTGTMAFQQIESFRNGYLTLAGSSDRNFPNLVDATTTTIIANRGNVNFPVLTSIENANLTAIGGSVIALPLVTEYRHASTGNDQHRTIRAEGVGSRIDLSNVIRIEGGIHWNSRLFVQAVNGGEIDLSKATSIEEATSGDFSFRSIDTTATGAGSLVRLDALTSYTDEHAGVRNSVYSTISASLGGEVRAPLLTTLRGVNLQLDPTGTIPFDQIETLQNGYLSLSGNTNRAFSHLTEATGTQIVVTTGTTVFPLLRSLQSGSLTLNRRGTAEFPQLSNIDNASLIANDGSVISLPLVTEYRHASTGNDQHRTIRAEGDGSRIALPNVVRIEGGIHWNSRLFVQAINGGEVDLSKVISIEEATGGDFRHRSIDTTSTGAGSLVLLDALTSYTDEHAGVSQSAYSTLSATRGGAVRAPLLTTLRGVDLVLDGSATFAIASISAHTNGKISLNSVSSDFVFTDLADAHGTQIQIDHSYVSFPALVDLTDGNIALDNNGRINLPLLSEIDGAAFSVADGTTISIPSATTYSLESAGRDRHIHWRADGARSVINLPNVESITGGTAYNTRLYVGAFTGGQVSLPAVESISDPSDGDFRYRAIGFTVEGIDSVIDLSGVVSISDRYAGSRTGENLSTTADIRWGGVLRLGSQTAFSGVDAVAGLSGTIEVGDLHIDTDSSLSGNGFVSGSVINGGVIAPTGRLEITGDYQQNNTGSLTVTFVDPAGTAPQNVVAVGGTATLAGGINVGDFAGFTPQIGLQAEVLVAQTVTGKFDAATGLDVTDSVKLRPVYSIAAATLQAGENTGPSVVGVIPNRTDRALEVFDVSFDEALNAGTVAEVDFAVTGPDGVITITSVSALSPQLFRVQIPVQVAAGQYSLTVGPNVSDTGANLMDQDRDGTGGEASDDQFTFTMDLTVDPATPIPSVGGDGVFIEVFNGVGGSAVPEPSTVSGLVADGTTLSPVIDFPRPGSVINVGTSFNIFFGDTTVPPDELQAISAANFTLQSSFYLAVEGTHDLNPATSAIDIRLGVGSDDGFYLSVDDRFVGSAGPRGFAYSWYDIALPSEGLFPVSLLYSANASGGSGLEFSWETATDTPQIVPQSHLYLDEQIGQQSVTFEEHPAGTVVADQYENSGIVFRVTGGDLQITDAFPSEFVPVSGTNVFGDANVGPAATGEVEFTFVVPGTATPAVTDFFSLFVIDAEATGATVKAYNPAGGVLFDESYHGGGATQERVRISAENISRVVVTLGAGSDTSAIDNITFNTPVEAVLSDLTVVSVDPTGVLDHSIALLTLETSDALAAGAANDVSTYRLTAAGADRQFGGSDDRSVRVVPSYADGTTSVELITASEVDIDLTTWVEQDYRGGDAGDWRVEEAGLSVKQYVNGWPTFYVSDFELIDAQFSEEVTVETSSDDDFIGVAFGYSATSAGEPDSYYLLQWKQSRQNIGVGPGEEGFKLLRVENSAEQTNQAIYERLWDGENWTSGNTSIRVLDSLRSSSAGWADNRAYIVTFGYESNGTISASIVRADNGAEVWRTTVTDPSPLGSGRVAFFNSSQSQVRYRGLRRSEFLPDGHYRLTVDSGDTGLQTADGRQLDGNADGVAGDAFTSFFTIDTVPPQVADVALFPTGVEITFHEAGGLEEAAATSAANYALVASGGDGTFSDGNEVIITADISNVRFDAAQQKVTLDVANGLADDLYRLTVSGTGIVDTAGHRLLSGSDYETDVLLDAVPASVTIELQEASDTGVSSTDNLTNVVAPEFDVTVSEAGLIEVDFEGDGTFDHTFSAAGPDTYTVTPPDLSDGKYRATSRFTSLLSGASVIEGVDFEIDTAGPMLLPGASTEQAPAGTRTVRFSEPIDESVGFGVNAALTGPDGQVTIAAIDGADDNFTISFSEIVTPGDYTLSADPVIRDRAGNLIDQNQNGTGGEAADAPLDQFTLIADTTAPYVVELLPSGFVNSDVSSVIVSFSEAILIDSFTPDDVAITGPLGSIPQSQMTVTPLSADRFEVSFPDQRGEGQYEVSIGPNVTDMSGNPMQPIDAADATILTFEPTAPNASLVSQAYGDRVTQTEQNGFIYGNDGSGPYTPHIEVEYGPAGSEIRRWDSEYGDLQDVIYVHDAHFGRLTVTLRADQGWDVLLHGFDLAAWRNVDRTIDRVAVYGADGTVLFEQESVLIQGDFAGPRHTQVDFAAPLTDTILVIELVTENLGDEKDDVGIDNIQFSEHRAGAADDGVFRGAFTIDRTSPSVASVVPFTTVENTVDAIDFSFTEPVNSDTLSISDLTVTGPQGSIPVTGLHPLSDGTWRATMAAQTRVGQYSIAIGPDVADIAGNLMNVDGDGMPNEPDDDAFTHTFSLIDTIGPTVADLSPQGLLNSAVDTIRIAFSEPIDFTSFSTADVSVSTPAGTLDWRTFSAVQIDEHTIDVQIPELSRDGDYSVSVTPAIKDVFGNTATGHLAASLTIDRTGPQVVLADRPMSGTIDIEFNESIPDSSLQLSDVVLNGPSGPVSLTGLQRLSDITFQVTFDSTIVDDGSYTLAIGPDVADAAGNLMDQDQDGLSGEAEDDVFTTSFALGLADLRPVSIAAQAATTDTLPAGVDAIFGSDATVRWTIENPGVVSAVGDWHDEVWLSSDDQPDGSDVLLGRFPAGNLASQQTYERVVTVSLPQRSDLAAGAWYLIVTSDAGDDVVERNESNNDLSLSSALNIQYPPLPDLAATAVTAPNAGQPGDAIEISWTVGNAGQATAIGTWTDRIFLAPAGDRSSAVELASREWVSGLEVGQSYDQQVTVIIPDVSDGDYEIYVHANADAAIFEDPAGASNDLAASPLLTVTHPDLTPQLISVPGSGAAGQAVTVEWATTNTGSGPTRSGWTDTLYLSADDTLDGGDRRLADYVHTQPVAAGGESPASRSFLLPIDLPGDYRILVDTDSANTIHEVTGEANNDTASAVLTIAKTPLPDFAVTNVVAPTRSIGDPAKVTISWTVENRGDAAGFAVDWHDAVILSSNSVVGDDDDIVVGRFRRSDVLTAGSSYTREEDVRLPPALTGRFYVFVTTDADNVMYEDGIENNNSRAADNTLEVMAIPYADLLVEEIVVPDIVATARQFSISWTVANRGIGITNHSRWIDRVSIGGEVLGSFDHFGQLAVDGSYTREVTVTIPPQFQTGNYTVTVSTGHAVRLREPPPFEFIYGNNNSRTIPIQVTRTPTPDLVIGDVTAPPLASEGSLIDVFWSVDNAGAEDAHGPWIDRVYLRRPGRPGEGFIKLGDFTFTGTLESGKSYSRQEAVRIPVGTNDLFEVVVITNALAVDNETLTRIERFGGGPRLYEAGVTNNNTAVSDDLLVQLLPRPDLQVKSITAPDAVDAGGTFSVDFTIINQGTVPTTTPEWFDRVYFSLDTKLTVDDIFVGEVRNQSALNPGEEYVSMTETLTVPKRFRGEAYVLVATDATGQVNEYPNDGNNVSWYQVFVNPLPLADLVVSEVVAPTQGVDGTEIEVRYTVTNLGSGATDVGRWTETIWLTRDRRRPHPGPRTGNGDILLKTFTTDLTTDDDTTTDVLGRNAGYDVVTTVTLPKGIDSGKYFITPWVNTYESVLEDTLAINVNPDDPNEFNNNNYKARPFDLITRLPDLEVTQITTDRTDYRGGDRISFSYTVENRATTETPNVWTDVVYLSMTPDPFAPGSKALKLADVTHEGVLGQDESYTETFADLQLSPSAEGRYLVVITDSPRNRVNEVYEDNNRTTRDITVTPAPANLVVPPESIVLQPLNVSGEAATIRYTLTNTGGEIWDGTGYWRDFIWISADPTFYPCRATYLGEHIHDSPELLGPGESREVIFDAILPAGTSGDYFVHIHNNAHNDRRKPGRCDDPNPAFTLRTDWWPPEGGSNGALVDYFSRWVYEDPRDNLSSAETVIQYREADLRVAELTVSDNAQSGREVDVQYRVVNEGTRATRTDRWRDHVFLSRDPSLDANDLLLGTSSHIGALEIGEFYDQSATVRLPESIGGDFYILVYTDSNSGVDSRSPSNIGHLLPGVGFEPNRPLEYPDLASATARNIARGKVFEYQDEGNNVTAQLLPVELIEPPNLQVTQVTYPDHVIFGRPFDVSWTVSNAGGDTVPGQTTWSDRVYLSRDTFLDVHSDRYLTQVTHENGLAGGASYEASTTIVLPEDVLGPWYLIVITDPVGRLPRGRVFEQGAERDNDRAGDTQLIVEYPPPADIDVVDISIPREANVGDRATISWTVSNISNEDAEGIWSDAVYLSQDTRWDSNDRYIGRVEFSGKLEPGEEYSSSIDLTIPSLSPGDWRVIVRADIFNQLYEDVGDKNNTTLDEDVIDIRVPSLTLGVPLDTTLSTGQERLYTLNAPIDGTLRVVLSTDVTDSANEIFIRHGEAPTTTVFDAAYKGALSSTQTALIPSTKPGTYFVLVRGHFEPEDDTPVTILAEMLPLSVSNIHTDVGGDGRFVTTLIEGAQFHPDAIVKLIRPGIAEYEPAAFRVLDATRIKASFDLTGAPHGLYDLRVTNPDGESATIPYRFLVERVIEPEVTVSLGGPRFILGGDSETYSVGFQNLGNIDAPYTYFEIAVPELGQNENIFNLPYLWAFSNVRGAPEADSLSDVPWETVEAFTNRTEFGHNIADGYLYDHAADGFGGVTFNIATYPGLRYIFGADLEGFKDAVDLALPDAAKETILTANPDDLTFEQILGAFDLLTWVFFTPFQFHVSVAATSLTRDEYIAKNLQDAEILRLSVLNDENAPAPLLAMAADKQLWAELYIAGLEEAELLRPEDDVPPIRERQHIASVITTLSAGILAGPAGEVFTVEDNMAEFFESIRRWYGHDPTREVAIDTEPETFLEFGGVTYMFGPRIELTNQNPVPVLPTFDDFDLGLTRRTHAETFRIYAPWVDFNRRGDGVPQDFQLGNPDGFEVTTTDTFESLQLSSYYDEYGVTTGIASISGPVVDQTSGYLPSDGELPFTVNFQNDPQAATTVSEVRVVTLLDDDLDPRTFRLGDISLGDIKIDIPEDRGVFLGDFNFRESHGFDVRVSAGVDLVHGEATWLIQAIDPLTGDVLRDPHNGFLPPNNALGDGAGFVSWTVSPWTDRETGTPIEAQARVLFDNAPPEDTFTLQYVLDGIAPATQLTATPLDNGTDHRVEWHVSDDDTGSGFRHVTLYVATDGGDFKIWQLKLQASSGTAVFEGLPGHTYEFLALATDMAGNREQPPFGSGAEDDGSQVSVGSTPVVEETTPPNFGIPPVPTADPSTNPTFTEAETLVPNTLPVRRPSEFDEVISPFTAEAFATGFVESHAQIGPLAIVETPSGDVLISGGPARNQIFHFGPRGGEAVTPWVELTHPIFDLDYDPDGRLWAATGGGPLVELDPTTGQILNEYGDGVTMAVAVEPVTGRIFVSTGRGVETFDPETGQFTRFSRDLDLRVGSLAFDTAGDLWATTWPDRNQVVRFTPRRRAETMFEFDSLIDSIDFGQPGSRLEGLLFVSHNTGPLDRTGTIGREGSQLTMIDPVTFRRVAIADGGTRGDIVRTTRRGRILLSQSNQVDAIDPALDPIVIATNPPHQGLIALPLPTVTVTFDQDMFNGDANDPRSVTNRDNYSLTGSDGDDNRILDVRYDEDNRTAILTIGSLSPDTYRLTVSPSVESRRETAMIEAYMTEFMAMSDFSAFVDIDFADTRTDALNGTTLFDVTVTNRVDYNLELPMTLVLEVDPFFIGRPAPHSAIIVQEGGRWLLDLAPAVDDGVLEPNESTSLQTITILNRDLRRMPFQAGFWTLPTINQAPEFTSLQNTVAAVGQSYRYDAVAEDPDGVTVRYFLAEGPTGMTVDENSGQVTWTPADSVNDTVSVVLHAYDSRGGKGVQEFDIEVDGGNHAPVISGLTEEVLIAEGDAFRVAVQVTDEDNDALVIWADNLPGGATFDASTNEIIWTPDFESAGIYPNVSVLAWDGLRTTVATTTLLIAQTDRGPEVATPLPQTLREGDVYRFFVDATDPDGDDLTFTSDALPAGASLDAISGLFEWRIPFDQKGQHTVPITVTSGDLSVTVEAMFDVLNANGAPFFDPLDGWIVFEGEQIRFRAFATDPDNPNYVPQNRLSDGSLTPLEGPAASVTWTASGLPPGSTFDPETAIFDWTPDFNDVGEYEVTFTATDDGDGTGRPLSATVVVPIRVRNFNRPRHSRSLTMCPSPEEKRWISPSLLRTRTAMT